MKTTWKSEKTIERSWYIVDVSGKVLGRAATQIASLLIGKGKIDKVPNMDCGDYVVVLNASKIRVTGTKKTTKAYHRHSGYRRGFRSEVLGELMEERPEKVMYTAVKNMLPNSKLRDSMLTRLNIYAENEHPHDAQKPVKVEL